MEIYWFSKWRPSAMLDFRNLTFSSSNIRVRAIMPPHSKFHLNQTIWSRVIATNDFNMASVGHLEFGNFWIFVTFPSPCSKFASAYQISSNSDDSRLIYGAIMIFKMAAVRYVGFSKFDIFIIKPMRVIMPPNSKFRLNRTIWSRAIAKKWFSIWRPSTILNFGISEFFSHFRWWGQNLRPHTKFRRIRTIHGWDMEIRFLKWWPSAMLDLLWRHHIVQKDRV